MNKKFIAAQLCILQSLAGSGARPCNVYTVSQFFCSFLLPVLHVPVHCNNLEVELIDVNIILKPWLRKKPRFFGKKVFRFLGFLGILAFRVPRRPDTEL